MPCELHTKHTCGCCECLRVKNRQQYIKHRERNLNKAKQYRIENKSKISANKSKYYTDNKDLLLDKGKEEENSTNSSIKQIHHPLITYTL